MTRPILVLLMVSCAGSDGGRPGSDKSEPSGDSGDDCAPATELCDGEDNDCDGLVDDDDPDLQGTTWHPDTDGDGLGDGTRGRVSCEAPAGHVSNADDTVGRVQGRMVNSSWEPLVGVTVTVGDEVSTTDEDGFFYVDDLTTDSAVDVYGRAEGYTTGHRQMEVYPERWSFVTLMLLPMESGSFEASTGGDLTLDGVSLSFPADAIADEDGVAYSGPVTVEVGLLDDADELLAAPGNMLADDGDGGRVALQSFGMAEVRLSDAAGAPLNLASGSAASVSWTLVGAADFEEGDAVGLFWFDEDAGIWRRDDAGGEARGGAFVAEVSHFTWWNADAFENLDGCALVELADPDHPDELIQDCSNVVFVDRDSFAVGYADWDGVNERCTLDIPLPQGDGECSTGDEAWPALDLTLDVFYNIYQWTWTLSAEDADCMSCDLDADVPYSSEFTPRGGSTDGTATSADVDGDGYYAEDAGGSDCDDGDASVHPRADDPCDDGIDGDCDGATDDDQDGDGVVCEDAGGDDCDDADPSVGRETEWYPDSDGDGYGDAEATPTVACALSGAVADGTDCDDDAPGVHPGATEGACDDAVDSNCDGYFGTEDAIDHDGDGASACTDCDDADGSVGAPTVSAWYPDEDGDGYGDPEGTVYTATLCEAPAGYSALATDCDDGESGVHPGAAESCDNLDTDCDGLDTALSVYDKDADPGLTGAWYSIQEAIDASVDRDVVCVHAGTYEELVDLDGRAIDVLGVAGPELTVIDGAGSGPVVTFDSLEDRATTLSGFTITGGVAGAGGGVYISGASPTLDDLIVTGNTAENAEDSGAGGGIYMVLGGPLLSDVVVEGNTADGLGGGVEIEPGCDEAQLSGVTVSSNSAPAGGGLTVWGSDADLSGVLVSENSARDYGGGLFIYDASPTLTGATVEANQSTGEGSLGGGALIYDAEVVLDGVTFTDNRAPLDSGYGGALYVYVDTGAPEVTISASSFDGNRAFVAGNIWLIGTSAEQSASLTIEDSTFTDDYGDTAGVESCKDGEQSSYSAGLFVHSFAHATVMRSAFWDLVSCEAGGALAIYGEHNTDSSESTLELSNVLIAHNASPAGAGMYVEARATVNIRNTTFDDNLASAGTSGSDRHYGGAIWFVYGSFTSEVNISDTIFSNNTTTGVGGILCSVTGMDDSNISILTSDFYPYSASDDAETYIYGDGLDAMVEDSSSANLFEDPVFLDTADYFLAETSPLLDVGSAGSATAADACTLTTSWPSAGSRMVGAQGGADGCWDTGRP